ncbi:MAG TPA: DUF3179 domain-containing protein [Vicinamibacteria bacterium]|nr:DUF3179 domain-containing protein [Vicinamibacteria bacterium]
MLIAAAIVASTVSWSDARELFSDEPAVRRAAIDRLREARDLTVMAGLNDVLYYHYTAQLPSIANEIAVLMEALAGDTSGSNPRRSWAEWVGRHDEIEPKEGYVLFKRFVFERYDPAFRGYFQPRFVFRIRAEEIEWGGVNKDGIPALDRPGFVPAHAATYLKDDERVFGVFLAGEAKAYPHRILDAHEMANDVVGGRHVTLSYCTLCGSGILFDGEHPSREGKEPFTFGSSGLLYRSNKLMYDRPTNSLWNNLTGEPVVGRLAESGIRLEKRPLVVSTWGDWRKRHPTTLVLDINGTGFDRDYTRSPYEDYFASDETMFPVWLRNDSLRVKEWIFGLIVNGRPKAYPIELLKSERVVHDRLGGTSLVLVTSPDSGAVRAYEAGERQFAFGEDAGVLVERKTRERWRVEEEALVSPSGESLPRLSGHNAFWFGWYAFFPTTDVYRP